MQKIAFRACKIIINGYNKNRCNKVNNFVINEIFRSNI